MGTETINWTTEGGTEITVTVRAVRKTRRIGTDEWTGEALTRDEGLGIEIVATAKGMGEIGRGCVNHRVHPDNRAKGYVATLGKLGLRAEDLERIEAAEERVMASPEMVAQTERRIAREAEMDADDAMRRRIEGTA